jgi:phosphoribosylanthranilate isomerase
VDKSGFLVKVCGINRIKNLDQVSQLPIDMIGINFYLGSKRFIGNVSININPNIKRVGIFVNPTIDEIIQYSEECRLDYVQLHGAVDTAFCKEISKYVKIIKAFGVHPSFDFKETAEFDFCDYFLFDTASKEHGGTGQKFPWSRLDEYEGTVPFLLAGGIGPEDVNKIVEFQHPKFIGVDINSKFEIEPGLKNVEKVDAFVQLLKSKK